MEAAASLAVPASAGFAMGGVGVTASALAAIPSFRPYWIAIWFFAALVAAATGGLMMARRAFAQGRTLFGAQVRKFLLCLVPSLFAGAVLTLVEVSDDRLSSLAGTWLLLYGCSLIAASAATTGLIGIMGVGFLSLSVPAFFVSLGLQDLLLGLGFGGLHLFFGYLIGRNARGH
jgi:hypothetical protein